MLHCAVSLQRLCKFQYRMLLYFSSESLAVSCSVFFLPSISAVGMDRGKGPRLSNSIQPSDGKRRRLWRSRCFWESHNKPQLQNFGTNIDRKPDRSERLPRQLGAPKNKLSATESGAELEWSANVIP